MASIYAVSFVRAIGEREEVRRSPPLDKDGPDDEEEDSDDKEGAPDEEDDDNDDDEVEIRSVTAVGEDNNAGEDDNAQDGERVEDVHCEGDGEDANDGVFHPADCRGIQRTTSISGQSGNEADRSRGENIRRTADVKDREELWHG